MLRTFLNWLEGAGARPYREVWFVFDAPVAPWAGAGLIALVFAAGLRFWARRSGRGPALLRALGLALALFLVLGPALVARRLEPGRQFVPVLFDDSRSMRVPGEEGKTRSERLAGAAGGFLEALGQSFRAVPFGFGERPERIRGVEALGFDRRESDIAGAVEGVLRRMEGAPVSAVVVFTDGVSQGRRTGGVERLPRHIPVFTVGVGREDGWRDLALSALSVSYPEVDRVAVTARVRAEGMNGKRARVEVLAGTHAVASETLKIEGEADTHSVRLEFSPQGKGWRTYRVRVRPEESGVEDRAPENNERSFAVDNRERTYRILYFSGRPGWENKFVRRALDGAPQLALSSLIRISGPERKFVFRGRDASMANPLFEGFDDRARHAPRYDEAVFIRIGVAESELAAGYPLTAEELFRYHLVIWGEIERGFFSQGQLELTQEFVSRRGGSLLLMGGPHSFAGEDWRNSTIEPMLPVAPAAPVGNGQAGFHPRPTIEGLLSGIWALHPDPARNAGAWADLPPLFGVNPSSMTRAGATVLAQVSGGPQDGQPLFAWQRYGEGTCAVMTTGETWQWHLMTPVEDASHARFWRQLARSLATRTPEPVTLVTEVEDVVTGEARELRFVVRDSAFVRREGLSVEVEAEDAEGRVRALPVTESIEEAGSYAAAFQPEADGLYRVSLTARDAAGATVSRLETAVLAHPDHREFESPRYNPAFLQAIAAHTGGAFFTLDELDRLVERIPWTDSQDAVTDRFALWHWPPFYAALALLFAIEWYLRRKRGAA